MTDEITFTNTKANSTVVKKKVPGSRDGDWKAWLTWVLNLQEFQAFMGYTLDQGDQWAMAQDIQVLQFDENLRFFSDIFREEVELQPNITLMALRQLTPRHCPPGTRGVLMDELMQLRKKKGTNVREYNREFRTLLRMFSCSDYGENEAVPEADIVRMYKMGMPVNWQVELHPTSTASKREERNNQRPRNNNQGRNDKYCSFCKRNYHNGNKCFRDPASPAYRPRNSSGAQYQLNRNHQTKNFGGGDRNAYNNSNNSSMAAMQGQIAEMAAMMKTLKQRQNDEYAAVQFYDYSLHDTMASRAEMATAPGDCEPRMEIEELIGSVRLTALPDTGCTNSALDQKTLSALQGDVVLEPETAKYRNADNSPCHVDAEAVGIFKHENMYTLVSSSGDVAISRDAREGLHVEAKNGDRIRRWHFEVGWNRG
ncbi:hypothetical protein GN958_ATG15967 [Phytophthora infestans]|uniref:Retrotransposon gag domain-containing protein n=1 Tax=Phytophthora infestans TaxID=4787 RepID=A0A8S9U1A2_PHYIN|nr:hypothetical protein GN958_ATG15967 [Phytophthora infestans]